MARAWRYNLFVSTCPRIPYDDLVTRGISGRLSHGRLIREDEEQNKLFENLEVGIDRLADDPSILATNTGTAIRKLKRLFLVLTFSRRLHFCIKVQRDVGQLLLDVTNDFALGCCRERAASFRQDLHHIFCEITSSKVQSKDVAAKRNLHRLAPCGILHLQSSSQFLWYVRIHIFCSIPTIISGIFGRPRIDGKTAREASSPAKPALTIPLPLSQTRAATSSSPMAVKSIARTLTNGSDGVASWQLEPIQSTYGQASGPRGRKTPTSSYEPLKRAYTQ